MLIYVSETKQSEALGSSNFLLPIVIAIAIPYFYFIVGKDLASAWSQRKGNGDKVPFGYRFWRFAAGLVLTTIAGFSIFAGIG